MLIFTIGGKTKIERVAS